MPIGMERSLSLKDMLRGVTVQGQMNSKGNKGKKDNEVYDII